LTGGRLLLEDRTSGAGAVCREILAALPGWFGIAESVDEYVSACDRSPTVVGVLDGSPVGVLNVQLHSPHAAEIVVMAVVPGEHRRGIGTALLRHAESGLVERGVEYLQVKTLSARRDDAGYERTRAFYFASGFRVLEESPVLFDAENPAVQLVKALPSRPRA